MKKKLLDILTHQSKVCVLEKNLSTNEYDLFQIQLKKGELLETKADIGITDFNSVLKAIPKSGDIMGNNEENAIKLLPLQPVKQFTSMVFVQDHPGKLKCGFTPLIHVRTSKIPCKMVKIVWKCGKSTGNVKISDNVDYIEAGDQAEVIFKPLKQFVVQTFDKCAPLARMAAMDSNSLVLMGKIVNVDYQLEKDKNHL